MAVLRMDFSLKTVTLREIKTPRNVGDALKPKSKNKAKKTTVFTKFFIKNGQKIKDLT